MKSDTKITKRKDKYDKTTEKQTKNEKNEKIIAAEGEYERKNPEPVPV